MRSLYREFDRDAFDRDAFVRDAFDRDAFVISRVRTAEGPRRCVRYIESSLNGGSFPYYDFSRDEKFTSLYRG